MNDAASDVLSCHQIARAEIDAWRGRCVDLFARGEYAVSNTLEKASLSGRDVQLRHLAGQRLADLRDLSETIAGTQKQKSVLATAIGEWHRMETHRTFLAHGVAKELLDRSGKWFVQLDFANFKAGKIETQRRSYSAAEAFEMEKRLEERFKALSAQLGQLRKRL